nr:hypothetical protein [Candidatus Sigynarchaeota archaeon]
MPKIMTAKGSKGEDASPISLYFDTIEDLCSKGFDMLEEMGFKDWRTMALPASKSIAGKALKLVFVKMQKAITEDDDYTGLAKDFLDYCIDWARKKKEPVLIEIK